MNTLESDIAFTVIEEDNVTNSMREEAGNLLPKYWVSGKQEIIKRGWVQNEPIYRVLAHNEGGLLVAQGSLVDITSAQNTYTYSGDLLEPVVLGLAEGVVKEDYRERGIGSKVIQKRVELAEELGAGVIMAASDKPKVLHTLVRLNFREVNHGEFFYSEGKYRQIFNPSWYVRGNPPRFPWQISNDF